MEKEIRLIEDRKECIRKLDDYAQQMDSLQG